MGWSLRRIAEQVNCSASTVLNEVRRGTPPSTGSRGRAPGYSAKRGQAVYHANRSRSHKPHKTDSCSAFISWVVQLKLREHHWSFDACVGYVRLHRLFKKSKMMNTKTLYNELWAGRLPLSIFEVPDALKRRHTNEKSRISKRPKGRSIEDRLAVVTARAELGLLEADTVVLLSRKMPDDKIEIDLNLDEMDITASESKATYDEIKSYVQDTADMKITNFYISQVKRKLCLEVGASYNMPKSEGTKIPQCPPNKEKAITNALDHFGMLPCLRELT